MCVHSISASVCRSVFVGILPLLLVACTVADQYGSRSIEYNKEASKSRSSTIVLNILRAAYRQPLQFTDLSTVTGTASASGTLAATIPQQIAGPLLTAPSFLNLTPSATLSGGPQFGVANQNTQEFYQGIQSPLEPQIFASYLASGVPLKVLLPLFVSEIELEYPEKNQKISIKNNANTEGGYRNFNNAVSNLIAAGLDIEPIMRSEVLNEAMTPKSAGSAQVVAAQISAASNSGSTVLPIKASKADFGRFDLVRNKSDWRFCFNLNEVRPFEYGDVTFSPLKPSTSPKTVSINYAFGAPSVSVVVTPEFQCGAKDYNSNPNSIKSKVGGNLKFTYRSLEGLLLYLGDMVRTDLGLGGLQPAPLDDPRGGRLADFKVGDRSAGPGILFRLRPNYLGSGISTDFDGIVYTAAVDPTGLDASGQVIQIITDLIALKSSAKSLPSPNTVVAVVP